MGFESRKGLKSEQMTQHVKESVEYVNGKFKKFIKTWWTKNEIDATGKPVDTGRVLAGTVVRVDKSWEMENERELAKPNKYSSKKYTEKDYNKMFFDSPRKQQKRKTEEKVSKRNKNGFVSSSWQLDYGFNCLMKQMRMVGVSGGVIDWLESQWRDLDPIDKESFFDAYHAYLGDSYSSDGDSSYHSKADGNYGADPSFYEQALTESMETALVYSHRSEGIEL